MVMIMTDSRQKRGGLARAAKLSSEEKSKIASEAAQQRWSDEALLPKVDFAGNLHLGDIAIPCAVLTNGTRVISENGIANAILGGRSGASKRKKSAAAAVGEVRPVFIAPRQLDSYITEAVREGILQPIRYKDGRSVVIGYDARILRAVCEIWLAARAAGALQDQQLDKAQRAEILMRALADVGIVALVDEATGYQQFRARDELQRILSVYVAEELLPWAKRFPDAFYEQLHRVWGWSYSPGNNKRTAYIGRLTNWLIYEQLPPGVLDELRKKNPKIPETGRRRHTHHQHLTEEVGHPNLSGQIQAVTTLLRATPSGKPDFFRTLFRNAFPSRQLELFPDLDPNGGYD